MYGPIRLFIGLRDSTRRVLPELRRLVASFVAFARRRAMARCSLPVALSQPNRLRVRRLYRRVGTLSPSHSPQPSAIAFGRMSA
jgi:hypothetical protein